MRLLNVIIISGFLLALILVSPPLHSSRTASRGVCDMVTLDIGQGDAILFRTPDKHYVLFDGGLGSAILDALGRQLPAGVSTIDLVVTTHPDADHLSGLIAVLDHYRVQSILTTGVSVSTQLFQKWQRAVAAEQATILHAQAGRTYTVGSEFQFEEVWPTKDYSQVALTESSKNGAGGTNDTSVAGRVVCSGSSAMMTGDLSYAVESQLAQQPAIIHSSVLKAGHHGSRYATTADFLKAVDPSLVVISVGKNNRYGHPHPTVIDRLQRAKIPFLRTDQVGDIVLHSTPQGAWNQ